MTAVEELQSLVGTARACDVLGVARASLYRWRDPEPEEPRPRPTPPRALSPQERQTILETLNSEEFSDKAPAEVYATLLDQGRYLCSIRTMYRVLDSEGQVRERRDQLRHPSYKKPEILATGPNQVWSWDITKLLGPAKWTYFYLYVILDIFSRYVVGWMLAHRESAVLAEKLITETVEKEGIQPGQLVIHADRGSSMASKSVALLLADLGVTKSHSRPHVSNDNPYSEAQFKTLKYRPETPQRYGSIEDARAHFRALFDWYNLEHRHLGIALLTPAAVHHGKADEILKRRQEVIEAAYATKPERFVHGSPVIPPLPQEVWINPPTPKKGANPSSESSVAENGLPGSPINDVLGSPRPLAPPEKGAPGTSEAIAQGGFQPSKSPAQVAPQPTPADLSTRQIDDRRTTPPEASTPATHASSPALTSPQTAGRRITRTTAAAIH